MSFMLDDVGLTHGNGFVALSHIHLSAMQGESIALIGPSGAGKTSLLNTIGTHHLPTAGRMQVLGQAASAQSPASTLKVLRSRIGTVHQAAPIPLRQRVVTAVLAGKLGQWPLWKALASLAYPQDLPGARDALARVQLEDKLFARCDQLSGGQLQRVGIACVLYRQAELILADAPVSALDAILRTTVRKTGDRPPPKAENTSSSSRLSSPPSSARWTPPRPPTTAIARAVAAWTSTSKPRACCSPSSRWTTR